MLRRSWSSALLSALLVSTLLAPAGAASADEHEPRVLVFSATAGFRHGSIEDGIAAIEQLGTDNGFAVDATEQASQFTDQNLANYDAVVWLSTTGSVLNGTQQAAFESYIRNGGGYVGIHAAADTHYDWSWYGGLVGAYFQSHPPGTQTADVWVTDQAHPSTAHLPSVWSRHDEWYDYNVNPRGDVHVLATLDESSYADQVGPGYDNWMGHDHPIAWCHDYDGGRSWYTGGGHTNESFAEEPFLGHLVGGILWAAGEVQGDCGGTVWDNYEKVVLDTAASEPMALEVASDGRVFYVQRGGGIHVLDPDTNQRSQVANLDVYTGQENGLMGLALDPGFDDNDRIWLFYSPPNAVVGDNPRQHLSSFTLAADGTLDLASEQVVLEVAHQRAECCHSAGYIAFGPDGDLWISTGDDANPFESSGYTPIDERPGREAWDAQRTSANTADLRGKLLRIVPTADGSDYTIPEDNLFTSGQWDDLFPGGVYDPELGRPEIHSMGFRNPFRFSVDQTNGTVYLADYGPDAGGSNPNRGPGNQVTWHLIDEPQNIGWPYCKGPNLPYIDYDFATGQSGDPFDCDNPVNDSPNNTGLESLPPSTPATVWYSYSPGQPFPMLWGGGPMGGPRYIYDAELDSDVKWPAAFDGSVVFAEWTGHRLYTFDLTDDGSQTTQISQILPDMGFSNPMDFDFGPHDGALYMIEWGGGGQIVRIEYTGPEDPDAPEVTVSANPTEGVAPLQVEFTGSATSPVDDDIESYTWHFGDGGATAPGPDATYTYTASGTYRAELFATDTQGRTGSAGVTITVQVDAPPPPVGELDCDDTSGRAPQDEFDGDELDGCRWDMATRLNPDTLEVADGELRITTTDGGMGNATNLILQTQPEGDWTIETRITEDMITGFQQGGLLVYNDPGNFVKFNIIADTGHTGVNRIELRSTIDGQVQPGPNLGAPANDGEWWLRLTKEGEVFTGHVSADYQTWHTTPQSVENPVAAAQGGFGLFTLGEAQTEPTTVAFDYFRLVGPGDLPCIGEPPAFKSDEFDGDELNGCRWDRVTHYNPDTLEVADGELRITTTDGGMGNATNLILQTQPEGDWTIETRITEDMITGFQQGGLLVYHSNANFLKFNIIADTGHTGVNRIELRTTIDGVTQPGPNLNAPANDGEWWLRLTKQGETFSGQVSVDHETWIDMPQALDNPVGAAQGGFGLFTLGEAQTEPTTVAFDYFHLLGEDPGEPDPPSVEAALDPADPDGNDDWYLSPVTLSLSSDDDEASLQWRDAGNEDWTDWSEPVVFADDGVHDLEYRAVAGGGPDAPSEVDVQVGAGGNVFVPDDIVVAQGGTITYERVDGFHDVVTFDDDGNEVGRSELSATWGTYEFEATQAGTFTIVCTPHEGQGMVGTVTVVPAGGEGLASEIGEVSFRIDQTPPETEASLDGESSGEVVLTLDAQDATSGVAETHWREAGDDGHEVYDGPVSFTDPGQHTVEYRSLDVAGNVEGWQEVSFTVGDGEPPAELELELTAEPRCLAGNVYLTVTARNDNAIPVTIEFDSRFGSRTFVDVTPDRFASHAFTTRATIIEDGWLTVRASAVVDGVELTFEQTVDFDGLFCVEPPIELEPLVSARCVSGNVYVTVRTRNDEEVPVDVEFASTYGTRAFPGLVPGRWASHAFATRAANVEDGWLTIRATAVIDGEEVVVERTPNFRGLSC